MGGHVFNNQSSPINKENISPTLNNYFRELKRLFPNKENIFNMYHFITLGSVGKKTISGDIDLGLDKSLIQDNWNLNSSDLNNELTILKKRAKTSTLNQLQNKAFLKVLAKYININSNLIHCNIKKITHGNLFTLFPQYNQENIKLNNNVQIDLNIGNLEWIKWSYFADSYSSESNLSGLHRTQLLLSAFQVGNLSFYHIDGLKNKDTKKLITDDPIKALQLLGDKLGFIISINDTYNYFKLFNLLNNMTNQDYNILLNIYFKILDSTRCDIPENLQNEWIARRHNLNLTGNFLPINSKLRLDI